MDWQFKQEILPSGLKVLTVPMPTESVTVLLMVRVGSRDEVKKLNGISHFFEHMVFKGTKKWPTPMAVNRVIDSVGGVFNAFTSQEHTGFWVKIAKNHLPLALEFLNQTVFHSLLPKTELEKERGVILEEIKMNEDNPMRFVYDQFVSQLYSSTSLGMPIIGTPENIKAVHKTDFVDHLKSWYQPRNMVLTVAGGLDKDASERIKEIFDRIKTGGSGPQRRQAGLRGGRGRIQVIKKDIQQLHFCLGLTTFERTNKDRYVLALLNTILGGNTSSHLWEEIREKRGLVYYVGSTTDSFFDTGYLVARAGCDVNRAEEALKVTLDELNKMPHQVSEQELKDAKEYIKGHLALSLEDSQEVADLFGEDLLIEGKVRSVESIIRNIDRVTVDQITALAKKLLVKERLHLTMVGPLSTRLANFSKIV